MGGAPASGWRDRVDLAPRSTLRRRTRTAGPGVPRGLSRADGCPGCSGSPRRRGAARSSISKDRLADRVGMLVDSVQRSEEHTSELQSLMRISYAVFCLKKKNYKNNSTHQ